MTTVKSSRTVFWFVLLGCAALWFYGLGARTLVPTDEGRYAEMAREMLASGDWVTTRLNGIKYFEKPPLQVWMNAATFGVFGLGEWQARLWTGLCGLLGIGAVATTGHRLFGSQVGRNAALVLGSSVLWAGLAHINTLDMGLSAMMTLSLCSLLLAQRDEVGITEQRGWMMLCWASMGLAVMSKGLIGLVLPGAVLMLYIPLARDWAILRRLYLIPGLLLFLCITVPWFLLVSLDNPEFPQFFFIHEHLQRFTSKVHHRAGPIYYFIPILLLGAIPWLGVLMQSLRQALTREGAGFQPKLMLLIWAGFIFLFFSVSSSKLPSYILPIFPALALLIACTLESTTSRLLRINAAILATIGALGLTWVHWIARLSQTSFDLPLYLRYTPWIIAASLIALLAGIAAWKLAPRRASAAIAVTALGGYLMMQLLMLGHDPLGRYAAGIDYVSVINAAMTPQTHLYSVNHYEQALPFYLRRTSTLVGQADEMAFGLQQQPVLWIPDVEEFYRRWRTGDKAIAVVGVDTYRAMQQRLLPMRVLASDPRRVIITNQP